MPADAEVDARLAPYRGWLRAVARSLTRDIDEQADLAQEGWIAMWRALRTFDPDRPDVRSAARSEGAWLTRAARLRMTDVARRGTWTGTPSARGHVRERPARPVDHTDPLYECMAESDDYDLVLWAYHRGVIARVLSELPRSDRGTSSWCLRHRRTLREFIEDNIMNDLGRREWFHYVDTLDESTIECLRRELAHLRP